MNATYGIVESGTVGRDNRYVNNRVYSNGTNLRVAGVVKETLISPVTGSGHRQDLRQ